MSEFDKLLEEAFTLGQVYWQQAVSKSPRHWTMAEKTRAEFETLKEKALGLISQTHAKAQTQYSDVISDGGMDPRNQQAQDSGEVAYFRKEMLRRCQDYAAGMTEIGADPADLEAALAPLLAPVGVEATAPDGLPFNLDEVTEWIEQSKQPAADRDIEADALQYVFGNMDRLDWARIVDEQLIPPWPLPHHVEAMGMSKQPAAVEVVACRCHTERDKELCLHKRDCVVVSAALAAQPGGSGNE